MGLHRFNDPVKDRSNRRTGHTLLFVLAMVMISMVLAGGYAAGNLTEKLPFIAAVTAFLLVSAALKFWRRKEASK